MQELNTKHTEDCLAGFRRRVEWLRVWPDCCKTCFGRGSVVHSGTLEPCDCINKHGKCPRCGEYSFDEETASWGEDRCSDCGWEPSLGGCPAAECRCGEEVAYEAGD